MTSTATDRIVKNLRDSNNRRADYVTYVAENNMTRDDIAEHAKALATLAYPKAEQVQKSNGVRTPWGNAVQLAGYHFRAILTVEADEEEKAVNLLTSDGVKDFGDMSDDDVINAVRAELERRNS